MDDFKRFVAFTLLHEEIGKSIQKIKNESMSRFGLRSGDALTLVMLSQHPDGLSAAELARKCGVDKAVVSRALPALLASGAVVYTGAFAGKRGYRARISLSPKGEEIVAQMREYSVTSFKISSGELSNEELATFYRVMRTVNRNLTTYARALDEESRKKGDSNEATNPYSEQG